MQENKLSRPDLEVEDHTVTGKLLKRDLSRLLAPNSTILDIGANRGQFALEVLEVLSEVKIYSFEPVKGAFEDLKSLSAEHPQIIPQESAVSLKTGQTTFHVTESDVGSSLLEPLPNQPSKWLTLTEKVTVNTTRLDDFIESGTFDKLPIDLLKVDAQGADMEVVLSAGKFLHPSTIKAILVEVNFTIFYDSQKPYHEIFAVLDKHGYRLAWLYPHRSHEEWLWWADALFIGKE
ncbi:FkbM family methyltransferase [Daejeonella sp.]|uniref:FkbM family methyltransferase n=1 Tax=Daejeonella sp. TaxID=2805397 RepID=UPI0030BBE778